MNKHMGFSTLELLGVIIGTAATVGWIMNIISIIETMDESITGMFILRCVGIFIAPLGAILGWL